MAQTVRYFLHCNCGICAQCISLEAEPKALCAHTTAKLHFQPHNTYFYMCFSYRGLCMCSVIVFQLIGIPEGNGVAFTLKLASLQRRCGVQVRTQGIGEYGSSTLCRCTSVFCYLLNRTNFMYVIKIISTVLWQNKNSLLLAIFTSMTLNFRTKGIF